MKNNTLIVLVFLIIYFIFIFSFRVGKYDNFIIDTKNEIISLGVDKNEVFDMADKTMEFLDSEKLKTQFIKDSLDKELTEKQKIINSFMNTKDENKKINLQNKILLDEQKLLLETLKNVTFVNEEPNKENEYLEIQYNNLTKYNERDYIFIFDTVYIIDTILYKKEEIEKLILKDKK